jgi:hypothetical protein
VGYYNKQDVLQFQYKRRSMTFISFVLLCLLASYFTLQRKIVFVREFVAVQQRNSRLCSLIYVSYYTVSMSKRFSEYRDWLDLIGQTGQNNIFSWKRKQSYLHKCYVLTLTKQKMPNISVCFLTHIRHISLKQLLLLFSKLYHSCNSQSWYYYYHLRIKFNIIMTTIYKILIHRWMKH